MTTIQNHSGAEISVTITPTNTFRLFHGASVTVYDSSLPVTVGWTNATTSTVSGGLLYQRWLIGQPGTTQLQEWDWVFLVPLLVWGLWLVARMKLRSFSRAFGSGTDNVME